MDGNIALNTNIWPNHCNGSTSQSSSSPTAVNNENQTIGINRKKSWSELKESVTELRKQLSRLSAMIPG